MAGYMRNIALNMTAKVYVNLAVEETAILRLTPCVGGRQVWIGRNTFRVSKVWPCRRAKRHQGHTYKLAAVSLEGDHI